MGDDELKLEGNARLTLDDDGFPVVSIVFKIDPAVVMLLKTLRGKVEKTQEEHGSNIWLQEGPNPNVWEFSIGG